MFSLDNPILPRFCIWVEVQRKLSSVILKIQIPQIKENVILNFAFDISLS